MISLIISHAEAVEANTHGLEDLIKVLMVTLGDGTRGDLFSLCGYNNRSAVIVGTADKYNVLSQPAEISDIEISRDICAEVS